jgi:hypothetical protein
MDANSTTIYRVKMQVDKFSEIISNGLLKIKSRMVKELIYGTQASKVVKPSNISRSLKEDIKLKIG